MIKNKWSDEREKRPLLLVPERDRTLLMLVLCKFWLWDQFFLLPAFTASFFSLTLTFFLLFVSCRWNRSMSEKSSGGSGAVWGHLAKGKKPSWCHWDCNRFLLLLVIISLSASCPFRCQTLPLPQQDVQYRVNTAAIRTAISTLANKDPSYIHFVLCWQSLHVLCNLCSLFCSMTLVLCLIL